MGKLVTVIDSTATLNELVVPAGIKQKLLDVIDWRKSSARVYGQMGVEKVVRLGRGLACLFSGSSGTGKTFASQCIANELGMNLYRIDLSQVVSKYIGETEKSLAQVFDESEAGHGVLFTTHDPNHAMRIADRAYLLRDGARIAEGPVTSVLTQAQLEALYQAPIEVVTDAGSGANAFLPGH